VHLSVGRPVMVVHLPYVLLRVIAAYSCCPYSPVVWWMSQLWCGVAVVAGDLRPKVVELRTR
jgi:hypothetical protein